MLILSYARIALLSLTLLLHLLLGEGFRKLLRAWRRHTPDVRALSVVSGDRRMASDLYVVPDGRPRPGLLVTHGVLETGKDDPRLVALATELAACGFAVLVPELDGLKSLRLDMDESGDIAAAFRFMLSREEVDETRAGLFGISFAAGPTLKAAADPSIRDRVKFVVSFGGYYDTVNIIRYLTTGRDEYRGHRHVEPPEIYARYVFVKNLLVHLTAEEDRMVLSGLLDAMERDAAAGAKRWEGEAPAISPDGLTETGRAVYDLIRNQDPDRVRSLMEATEPAVRDYLESLSLRPVVLHVTAPVLIGHGDTDPLIPLDRKPAAGGRAARPEPRPRRHPQGRQSRRRPPLGTLDPRVRRDDPALLLPLLRADLPHTQAAAGVVTRWRAAGVGAVSSGLTFARGKL